MSPLQIANRRERMAVRLADVVLQPLAWLPRRSPEVRRILLLRLERIGDLLMTIEAIDEVRRTWPHARIDLAVGSWNESIAKLISGLAGVHIVDVPWLSRGERPASWGALVRAAGGWRRLGYDMVINFEPDIRSNFLAWLSGAPVRVGYASGGGGALLTLIGDYDPTQHVSDNARTLVARAAGRVPGPRPPRTGPLLTPTPAQAARAATVLNAAASPIVGVHVSGGRASKQWHLDRFAAVAQAIAAETSATIVLTGSASDRAMVDEVARQLTGCRLIVLAGQLDLPETAAVLGRIDLFVTGDTGPMHLAAAMGTPVVSLFGPSDPRRYGPGIETRRVLRVQLPCSPCGQVRLPPPRCRGHVPDCMDGITVEAVVSAARELLAAQLTTRRAVTL